MSVRLLLPEDAALWRRLRLEMLAAEPEAYGTLLEEAEARTREDFAAALRSERIFAAFVGGAPVGSIAWSRLGWTAAAHRAHLHAVYLRAEHRGGGLADAMMRAVIADIPACIQQLELDVGEANRRARGFYSKHGFEVTGRVPRAMCLDGRYIDEVTMMLHLDRGA